MKAGRDLDVLIADRVMKVGTGKPLPHYSTDIAAAWQVVDKLDLTISKNPSEYIVVKAVPYFLDGEEPIEIHQFNKSAPLAICLVALEYVKVREQMRMERSKKELK